MHSTGSELRRSVTFLRHAESAFNADTSCSDRNCALTDLGTKQAAALSGSYSLVIMSPLRRAQQTLELSQIRYQCLEVWNECREQCVDVCDWLLDEEPVIETDDQLTTRVDVFLTKIRALPPHAFPTLVVSHCEFITNIAGIGLDNAKSITLQL